MIKLNHVSVGHENECLIDLNIEFNHSECCVVLGTNGVGKSCLLSSISGALGLKSGRIEGLSESIFKRANELSYCYQAPLQNSLIRVKDFLNLVEPIRSEFKQELISLLGVQELLEKSISKLSGGEKQRVKIVSVLMQNSKTIILDEPTTALDPYYIDQLIYCLGLLKQAGCCIVLASHDLNFAVKSGDRFIGLKSKTVLFDSSLEHVISNHSFDKLFNKKFEWLKHNNGGYALW